MNVLIGYIQKIIVLLLVVQGSLLAASQFEQQLQLLEACINWDQVKQRLEAYNSCPNQENAERLLATIPEKLVASQLGNRKAAGIALLESVFLTDAIIDGDEIVAEAAFRLLGYIKGGAVDETLTIALGRFLTRKPEIFLRLLEKYHYLFSSESEYPVTMTEIHDIFPDISSDDELRQMRVEQERLYRERIKALNQVQDPGLKELRDTCIRIIEAIIKGFKWPRSVDEDFPHSSSQGRR